MANHRKGNNYTVDKENNIAKIELQRRNKENLWVTIDLEDLERVINFPYTWFALWLDARIFQYWRSDGKIKGRRIC